MWQNPQLIYHSTNLEQSRRIVKTKGALIVAFDNTDIQDEPLNKLECSAPGVTANQSFPKFQSKISSFFKKIYSIMSIAVEE